MERWFAIRVRSNFEKVVNEGLQQRDIQAYLPTYRRQVRWSDRVKTVDTPLFPGYVFGWFEANRRLPVLTTPGVVQVLGDSVGPTPVDDDEMAAIRRLVASGIPIAPHPFLAVGEMVSVQEGTLAGLEGMVVRLKSAVRVVVSLSLLHRCVAVELDSRAVRPIRRRSPFVGVGDPGFRPVYTATATTDREPPFSN